MRQITSKGSKYDQVELREVAVPGTRDLPKTLTSTDLLFLGIGGIIGAGVFVLTGNAAKEDAGCVCCLARGLHQHLLQKFWLFNSSIASVVIEA